MNIILFVYGVLDFSRGLLLKEYIYIQDTAESYLHDTAKRIFYEI